MTEPSSADAGAGAEALLGLAAGRSVRLPSTTPDAAPPPTSAPAQPPPFLPPVERLPGLSEWRVEPFRPHLPPPLLEPPPPDGLRSAPWHSHHQYAYPWHVGYAYPPSQLYYYPQPLPYQRQPLGVAPPSVLQPEVPPLRSLTSPLDKLTPLGDHNPILPPPGSDVNSTSVQSNTSQPVPPARARGLADLINPTDTIPGTNNEVGPSHLSRAYEPVSAAPEKSSKSSLSMLVEAGNEVSTIVTPEKSALQTEPSDASTIVQPNASQSTCARPSPPEMVTPLRLLHSSENQTAQKETPKSEPSADALRQLVMPSSDLPREPRDVTRLSPNLGPVSKDSVTVITSQSPSPRQREDNVVDRHQSSSPVGNENEGSTHHETIRPSQSATSVANVDAGTSSVQNQESGRMPTEKVSEGQSVKLQQSRHLESYSDKFSERNSDHDQRVAAEDESKYHTPTSRSSRDANRSSGRGSRRSTKPRGRRSRRRPILINDLDSEENDDVNESEREASDGGIRSIGDEDEEGNSGNEVTRCPCGSKKNSGIMIACDQCDTWQHGRCMGFRRNADLPEQYFCHICRPDQVRPNCIAHPKYKERYGRDREGREPRMVDAESLLANIRPAELRKLFMSDLRTKKSPVRSRTDVFNRYASLFKTQFPKSRQAVVEGLSVILDLTRAETAERFESALRRTRSERPQEDSVDRKRNSAGSEADHAEVSNRNTGSGRTHGLKRSRSGNHDGAEGGTMRHDTGHVEGGVEIDLNSDSRGMSREERKLQQTMKLFARMEERERERKRPRTNEHGSSPKASPPGRLKTSRSGSQVRGNTSKSNVSPSGPENREVGAKPAVSDVRQQHRSSESKQKRQVSEPTVSSPSEPKQWQKPPSLQSQPDAEQAGVNSRTSGTSRIGGEATKDASRREKDSRAKDRVEKPIPIRKDSVSPDSHNFGNRRRKHMLTEKVRSNENKRRRTGSSMKDIDKKPSVEKEIPEYEKSVDIGMCVVGPSVLGSKKLRKGRVSHVERERKEDKEADNEDKCKDGALNSNRKEWLLMKERRIALNKSVGIEPGKSPVKKRVMLERKIDELEKEEIRANKEARKDDDETAPAEIAPTVSVSMVVVSEKGSLPDNGQILESTRLVLHEEKKDSSKLEREKGNPVMHALKKRPEMFVAAERNSRGEEHTPNPNGLPPERPGDDHVHKRECSPRPSSPKAPPKSPSPAPQITSSKPPTPTLRIPSPHASTPKHMSASFLSGNTVAEKPSSPRRSLIASPKLRSSPLPSFKSAIRSTVKSSLRESRSPSPTVTTEKSELQGERRAGVPATDTRDSRIKSSSPSPERSFRTNFAGSSNLQQAQGIGEAEKTETKKTERERSALGTSATKPEQKAVDLKPEDELVSDATKRPSESVEPAPAPAPTTTTPIPLSRSPAPPLNALRSIRSMPVAEIRKASLAQNVSNATAHVRKPKGNDTVESSEVDIPSSGATISDVFQRRLEGFWKPAAKTPVKPPAKPNSAPPPVSSIKGSTAKLGAALPLSSKPNLDSLRNSTGLSPRVSGVGNGYHRGSGSSFRSKSMDYDRSRGSIPSFSQSKRSHSFSHGRGYPRSVPHGLNNGKPSFHEDRRRFGPIRDSGHHGRDDDKAKNGGTPTQLWSRSYTYRNSRPSISDDHDRNMNRRPGGGPPDSDGLRRSRKPLQDSWMSMGGPRQGSGFLAMNGGSNRRMNGDNHGRGSRRGHGHHG